MIASTSVRNPLTASHNPLQDPYHHVSVTLFAHMLAYHTRQHLNNVKNIRDSQSNIDINDVCSTKPPYKSPRIRPSLCHPSQTRCFQQSHASDPPSRSPVPTPELAAHLPSSSRKVGRSLFPTCAADSETRASLSVWSDYGITTPIVIFAIVQAEFRVRGLRIRVR